MNTALKVMLTAPHTW